MKKLLLSVLTCLAFTVQIAARNGFAIVIDSVSYQEARPEVDAYARAIERLQDQRDHDRHGKFHQRR